MPQRRHLPHQHPKAACDAKLNVDDIIIAPQDARDTVRAYRVLGFDRLLFHPRSRRSTRWTGWPTPCSDGKDPQSATRIL